MVRFDRVQTMRFSGSTCRRISAAAALLAAGLLVVPAAQADISTFSNGDGWCANQGNVGDPPTFDGDSATLTTDKGNEHNSVFYDTPQSVTAFSVQFTYQLSGSKGADGSTFCIQQDPLGPMAVGTQDGGSSLGYQGISPSIAVAINIYGGHTRGTNLFNDGDLQGYTYLDSSPVDLHSGNPIQFNLMYDGTTLTEVLLDTVTGDTNTFFYDIDIPADFGASTGYVGFTGGTGGATSVQTFSGLTYTEM